MDTRDVMNMIMALTEMTKEQSKTNMLLESLIEKIANSDLSHCVARGATKKEN